MAMLIAGIGLMYSGLFGVSQRAYVPYVGIGFMLWALITGLIKEGCLAFFTAGGMIRQLSAPLSVQVYRLIWKNLIVFGHNILIYVAIGLIFGIWAGIQNIGLAILGLLAICVAEFSGLGDFLNMPIRTYSSGMHMRLSFSVSASLDPEILLLDEGIAVGDAAFIEKAERRMEELVSKAGILVLASHSKSLIKQLCNRAILLERGRVIEDGPVSQALRAYLSPLQVKHAAQVPSGKLAKRARRSRRSGATRIRMEETAAASVESAPK
jgi:hypothetical protein